MGAVAAALSSPDSPASCPRDGQQIQNHQRLLGQINPSMLLEREAGLCLILPCLVGTLIWETGLLLGCTVPAQEKTPAPRQAVVQKDIVVMEVGLNRSGRLSSL